MSKKRIILVEDERDMAELVAMRLTRENYLVECAYDGTKGLAMIRSTKPDLVILDIMLPGISGTEVLKQLRADPRMSNIPVIMLTAKTEEGDIVAGLQLGADDYVTKPFSMSVLTARVAAALRRSQIDTSMKKGQLVAGDIRINLDTHQVEVFGKRVSLTLTEFRLLVGLVSAKGRVLSRNQLMDHALGVDAIVTDRTIDVHFAALRRKLGKARKCIQTVRGLGYRLATEEYEKA
jgi:DNA-binding response OmpR family regulator